MERGDAGKIPLPQQRVNQQPEQVAVQLQLEPTAADAEHAEETQRERQFEFDSAFIKPEIALELAGFFRLWERQGRPPLSIFGHADPSGDDNHNKNLSGRRASAVYGLLTRETRLWEELYSRPFATDNWGALPQSQRRCRLRRTGR